MTFRVLATAPNLSITSPEDGSWHKNASVAFAGSTNGAKLTVKVGNGNAQNVPISDGTFTGNVTLVEGANTVTFVATSASGVDTTITRTLNLDTKAPVITNVTITPNPVDGGKTYVVAVEVTD